MKEKTNPMFSDMSATNSEYINTFNLVNGRAVTRSGGGELIDIFFENLGWQMQTDTNYNTIVNGHFGNILVCSGGV